MLGAAGVRLGCRRRRLDISYGPNYIDEYRLAASHVDRILKGEKPADLPVQASTKYELVVNLKTTKAIGLIVPTVIACERRRHDRIGRTTMHESGIGTNRTSSDVRYSVAIGGRPDMARKAYFGRD